LMFQSLHNMQQLDSVPLGKIGAALNLTSNVERRT
jgi:hypothetical protein